MNLELKRDFTRKGLHKSECMSSSGHNVTVVLSLGIAHLWCLPKIHALQAIFIKDSLEIPYIMS